VVEDNLAPQSQPAPDLPALWQRATELHGQGAYAEALAIMHTVEARLPGSLAVLSGLGVVYRDGGDLDRALDYLRRAVALQPEDAAAHFHLAVALLRAGIWHEGFREYEWRWRVEQFAAQRRKFDVPEWTGKPLAGRRILLHGEQGAGDAIQFVRYARLVRAAGGEVLIEILPHLERLMSWLDGGFPVSTILAPASGYSLHCPLMSLPQRLGTEIYSVPPPARFRIPPASAERWAKRLGGAARNVGLVWSANPAYYNNAARSLPANLLAPLVRLPGVRFWSLQVGSAACEIPEGITDLSAELTDFAETAAVLSQLNLVITVDTAVAHLAGSLGVPTWLLLHYASDWRWLLGRDDTPWYPGMRLLRQPAPGAWNEVAARVESQLRYWVASGRRG
jgi:hypothetical protein